LLRPVSYNLDIDRYNKHILPGKNDNNDVSEKEKTEYTGFIAQEVETAARNIGYNFSGIHHPENDSDTYTLSYAEFVVPLVKAVQELSDENAALKKSIAELDNRLAKIDSGEIKVQPVAEK